VPAIAALATLALPVNVDPTSPALGLFAEQRPDSKTP
jgi:hypothetical protein